MSNKINNKGDNNNNFIAGGNINITNQIPISRFVDLITIIGESISRTHITHKLTEPPDIKLKLNHNNLTSIETVIKNYSLYINTIEETKNYLNNNPKTCLYWSNTTDIIISKYIELENLNKEYTDVEIWYDIRNSIVEFNNIRDSVLVQALEIIMVHLFIKCKIFKEPK